MKYTIKPCVEGDAEYIWERQKAEYSFSEACEDGAEELLVLKACDENGNTVGGCVLSIDLSGTAEFNSLFVDEGFRRRGIGSAIALEAERAARSRGCKMMINAYNFDFQFAKPLFESSVTDASAPRRIGLKGMQVIRLLRNLAAQAKLTPSILLPFHTAMPRTGNLSPRGFWNTTALLRRARITISTLIKRLWTKAEISSVGASLA